MTGAETVTGAVAWLAVATSGSGDPSDDPPDWCLVPNANGDLPECVYVDGAWVRSFDEGLGPDLGVSSGVPAGFGAFFVIVLLLAIGGMVWRVSTARRLARNAGMDQGDATAMTLLTDHGLESTYLAANLRPPAAAAPGAATTAGPAEPARSSADRLRELQDLLAAGLVTQEEHDARRRAILDSL